MSTDCTEVGGIVMVVMMVYVMMVYYIVESEILKNTQ